MILNLLFRTHLDVSVVHGDGTSTRKQLTKKHVLDDLRLQLQQHTGNSREDRAQRRSLLKQIEAIENI